MKKWLKINGILVNLNHIMLINKRHKVSESKDIYSIDFTFVKDIVTLSFEHQPNILRINCKDKDDMDKTYNSIIEFIKGDLTYYER